MAAKVWITGGRGFVGRYVQAVFAQHQPDVEILATGTEVDMTQMAAIQDVLVHHRPDAVIHLAAIAAPAQAKADPERAWAINVDATRRLGMAILQISERPCRLVFAGSSEAYGASFNASALPLTEDAPLRPLSVYGATKAAADVALRQMSHDGLDLCCFRAFNHTGQGQSDQYVVPAFAKQVAAIVKGLAPPVIKVGNLAARRDFTHVRDIARAYMLAALDPGRFAPGEAYNLASGRIEAIGEVLDRLIAAAGIDIRVEVDPQRLRPNEVERVSANVGAVADRLGWRAVLSLEDLVYDVLTGALAEA